MSTREWETGSKLCVCGKNWMNEEEEMKKNVIINENHYQFDNIVGH